MQLWTGRVSIRDVRNSSGHQLAIFLAKLPLDNRNNSKRKREMAGGRGSSLFFLSSSSSSSSFFVFWNAIGRSCESESGDPSSFSFLFSLSFFLSFFLSFLLKGFLFYVSFFLRRRLFGLAVLVAVVVVVVVVVVSSSFFLSKKKKKKRPRPRRLTAKRKWEKEEWATTKKKYSPKRSAFPVLPLADKVKGVSQSAADSGVPLTIVTVANDENWPKKKKPTKRRTSSIGPSPLGPR